jgi:nucleoid DNA-binding protein
MNRSEYETRIQQKLEIPQHFIEDAVAAFIETIFAVVSEGGKVKIDDFGIFFLKSKPANRRKDAATGEYVARPDHKTIHFHPLHPSFVDEDDNYEELS